MYYELYNIQRSYLFYLDKMSHRMSPAHFLKLSGAGVKIILFSNVLRNDNNLELITKFLFRCGITEVETTLFENMHTIVLIRKKVCQNKFPTYN